MSLAGNLRTMALSEILQWIAEGRKTGVLHLERRSIRKQIACQDGTICAASSNDPREALGQYLVRENLVDEDQLFQALTRQEEDGRPLGALLLSQGLISEDQLRSALRARLRDGVYDLFFWREGRFEFKEGDAPEAEPDSALTVTALVLEGARRLDEWARLRERYPHRNARLRVEGPVPQGATRLEQQIMELVEAGTELGDIPLIVRHSDFDTLSAVESLHDRGLVSVAEPGDARWNKDADIVGAINELLGLAYERIKERRYDAALKAYEDILALDPLNHSARRGLEACMEARRRDKAEREVPLTAVPVMTMGFAELTAQNFDPHEGFVLSRINGQWDVESILKLCPMAAEEALLIFARLLERRVIELQQAPTAGGR